VVVYVNTLLRKDCMKKKVTLYLEETTWRDFRAACIQRGVSASQVIEMLIREFEPNDSQKDSQLQNSDKRKW
jgi:hypothetical protein